VRSLETEQSFGLGLKTAFVARPTEYGPLKYDFEANGDWAHVTRQFDGIADHLGC
jgi:2-haloacid dehalogenase